MSDASEMGVERAVERYLKKRQTDATERTLRGYKSRLNQFLKWCDGHGVETLGDLDAWTLDEYDLDLRDQGFAPTTIKARLSTLRMFLKYCESIDAVDEGLHESVDVPTLSKQEETNEERLAEEDAIASLEFFRDSRRYFGTPMHAFLEIAWHTGARMGSLRGLDLSDYDPERQYVKFVHRPSTGTPLKNKQDGERYVGVSDAVCEALDMYIARERPKEKRDDHGREPLFCSRQGRPSYTTIRAWSYMATQPCLWTECPHGKQRTSCEWTQRSESSKCPSSRSPHPVRSGSITWQLNQGYDIELVAERVNASVEVIKQHYDQATAEEEFEKRRRARELTLDISEEEENNDQ